MARRFPNGVKVATATTGTGTVSLGSAESGYLSFADAVTAGELSSGDTVGYYIEDESSIWELGTGTYTDAATDTLTRTAIWSSSGASTAISLTGSATVSVVLLEEDIISFATKSGTETLTNKTFGDDITARGRLEVSPADVSSFSSSLQTALTNAAINSFVKDTRDGDRDTVLAIAGFNTDAAFKTDLEYTADYAGSTFPQVGSFGVRLDGTSTSEVHSATGFNMSGQLVNGAVANNLYVNGVSAFLFGNSTLSVGYGYRVVAPFVEAGSTLTTWYDFWSSDNTGFDATTRYGVYIVHTGANYFGGPVRTLVTTVSGLPAATIGAGYRAFVTDANATTFASTVAGGGSNNVPVYSDGTNWKIG